MSRINNITTNHEFVKNVINLCYNMLLLIIKKILRNTKLIMKMMKFYETFKYKIVMIKWQKASCIKFSIRVVGLKKYFSLMNFIIIYIVLLSVPTSITLSRNIPR